MVQRLTEITFFIFEMNAALDSGKYDEITFEEVRTAVGQKKLFTFLESRLKGIDLSIYNPQRRAELSEEFSDVAEGLWNRERRKTGVENRGLCLLIAYATEIIQIRTRE